jgi:hypothetical protein
MQDLTGNWTVVGPGYIVEFDRLLDNTFRGHYVNINDSSVFVAQVFSSSRGTVMSMVQTHPERAYYAVYSTHLSSANTFKGSYADVDGNLVNFELVKQ